MSKKTLAKTFLILAGSSILFGCAEERMKGINLETATQMVETAVSEQNDFKVELTDYAFSSHIKEYVSDGWNKLVTRRSDVDVKYTAPYRIDDEKTQYSIQYSWITENPYNHKDDSEIKVKISRNENDYVVHDGNTIHAYSATTDSYVASFINLPSLIHSNSVETLSLCSQWISSIGTPTAPNKTNVLTSFEALSDKEGNLALTFKGESLPINQLYADENSLPANATITSLTVNCSNNRVDSYSSKYTFLGNVEKLDLAEADIEGEIEVTFTYGA